jgi:LPXTG-site transpeptidase (sortase) family protein
VQSPLASSIVSVGSMLYDPRDHVRGAPPVSVSVGSIGVRDSPIVGVGVDAKGAFAVPGVREVGWYEFGPRPGDPGSSVLAAHIAFDGVDGVFRRLASTKVGGDVVVRFVDGSSAAFVVTSVERIDKDELPAELFATSGPAQLVLISCGGAFNRDRQSYEDNIVVMARPVAQPR